MKGCVVHHSDLLFVVETKDKLKTEEKKGMAKEFDLEAVTAELDKEFEDVPVLEVPEEEEPAEAEQPEEEAAEFEEEDEEAEDFEEDDDEEESTDEEVTQPQNDPDEHRRNEAFKKLREERDKLAASDKFLEDLATEYGMTKDQLVAKYREELLNKQAKEQGVSKEQLKKMQELETKIQTIEEEKNREVFNLKANQIAEKYKLNDDQMMNLFSEASKMGVNILQNPDLLDFVYRAVNYDQAVEKGRQKQLETSKKRSATSTGTTGTVGRQVDTTEDDMQAEIEGFLKEQGIIKQ